MIETLRERFPELVIGLSDHQNGIAMALVAYMLGARVIEKHFTLNHAWKGTDHAFSLEPEGMRRLVRDLQRVPGGARRRREAPAAERGAAAREDGEEARRGARPAGRPRARAGDIAVKSPGRRRAAAVRARPARSGARLARPLVVEQDDRARRRRARGSSRSPPRHPRRDRPRATVRLAVFDFDGVFTDNRVWMNERGEESVACWRGDGLGLRRLDEVGVEYLIVSTETNPVVGARGAEDLQVECVQRGRGQARRAAGGASSGAGSRSPRRPSSATTSTTPSASRAVGLPGRPGGRMARGRRRSRGSCSRAPGGHGCVREFCDAVWRAKRAAAAA